MTIVHIEGNVEVNNKREIQQINKPINRGMTVLSRFRKNGEQNNCFLILSRDPVELLLVTSSGDGNKKYNLFTSSDRNLFYDGELGVGSAEWIPAESKLTFYMYYIVHDDLRKVAVCFNDEGSIQLSTSKADVGMLGFKRRDFYYL